MNVLELRKLVLAVLLAFAAAALLPACSSTEETDDGTSTSGDCNCADGDWNCMDRCTGVGG